MKLSFLVGGAVGYVLGAKAGRARYETIVRLARRVAGSQTMQSTAGVLQAQLDTLGQQARQTVAAKLHVGGAASGYSEASYSVSGPSGTTGTNGFHR